MQNELQAQQIINQNVANQVDKPLNVVPIVDQGGSAEAGCNPWSPPITTPSCLNHSAQIDQIIPALVAAKQKFATAVKDKKNPLYGSNYADLAAIERAIGPALLKSGLFLMQPAQPKEHVSGSIIVTITTILWHESGQYLSSTADIPYMAGRFTKEEKKQGHPPVILDAHSMGSLITYFRRYLKLAFLDIITDDDDGNQAHAVQNQSQPKARAKQSKPQPEPQPSSWQEPYPQPEPQHETVTSPQPNNLRKITDLEYAQIQQRTAKLDNVNRQSLIDWMSKYGFGQLSYINKEAYDMLNTWLDGLEQPQQPTN